MVFQAILSWAKRANEMKSGMNHAPGAGSITCNPARYPKVNL